VTHLNLSVILRPRCVLATFAVIANLMLAVACAADDLSKPLEVSSDGHFLTQPDGNPFFWLGDTAWDLYQTPDKAEIEQYLSDRARKDFTIIQAVIGGAAVHQGPNVNGDAPFIDDDLTRPNPRYFEHVDWVVERARAHGLRVAIVPYWGLAFQSSFFKPDSFPQANNPKFNAANAFTYGRWLGHRFRDRGVTWILGGDANALWPSVLLPKEEKDAGHIIDWRPIYDALATGLIEGVGGVPLITYHSSCCSFPNTPKPLTSLYFNDRAWLTLHMLHSSHYATPTYEGAGPQFGFKFGWAGPWNYEPVLHEYRATPARPVIDGEPRYEDIGKNNDSKNVQFNGYWTSYDARNAAYHAVFAGAAGHTYGNHAIWQFASPKAKTVDPPLVPGLTWQQALDRPSSNQMRHLKALMLSRPYFTRIPDQSLIVGNAGEGTAHLGATRDKNGTYAMVYVPDGRPFEIDLTKLSGIRLNAWWYNPRTGESTKTKTEIRRSQAAEFSPPTQGPDQDWVLVLDDASKGLAAPGSSTGFAPQAIT